MKDFVYFFKHKNISAIKIGKTSGESVNDRFLSFKTYSPYGAEIVGFFECDNGYSVEKLIHTELKSNRLSGEWFDISIEHVLSIIDRFDHSNKKIKSLFNEWISSPENDLDNLSRLFFISNQSKMKDVISKKVETEDGLALLKYFEVGDLFMTTTQILKKLNEFDSKKYNINRIGAALKKNNFKRISKGNIYGYLVKFNI